MTQTGTAARRGLTEAASKAMLAAADVPVTRTEVAQTAVEAVRWADTLGYPVVLKIVSEQILHKSDIGGVVLGLNDAAAVRAAFDEIVARGRAAGGAAAVQGVSVQPEVPPGTELIVGLFTDPQFGPVVMAGLGGIFVEVLKDVAFRVVPLAPRDAADMLRQLRGYPVLAGTRGRPGVDVAALEQLILAVSRFAEQHPEVVELDLNPVIAHPTGVVAVDARVIVED